MSRSSWSVANALRQARGTRNAIDRARIRYERDPERAMKLHCALKLMNATIRVLQALLRVREARLLVRREQRQLRLALKAQQRARAEAA